MLSLYVMSELCLMQSLQNTVEDPEDDMLHVLKFLIVNKANSELFGKSSIKGHTENTLYERQKRCFKASVSLFVKLVHDVTELLHLS